VAGFYRLVGLVHCGSAEENEVKKVAHHRSRSQNVRRGSVTVICSSRERAHELRHELDALGALSKRKGRRISTTATMEQIHKARKRAKRSTHHGHTR
jgi:hypothetical protein